MAEIYTRKGVAILVDDEDYPELSKFPWHLNADGYAVRNKEREGGRSSYSMARQIMGLDFGDKREVDHINGNRIDNRRNNLRLCDRKGNTRNTGVRKDSSTGLKGVCRAYGGKFAAYIRYKGQRRHLGTFDTAEDAHEFYCLAADMIHGEFANYG